MTALAQQLCFHNPSIFIDDFSDISKSLIRFSRHELGTSFHTALYSTRTWNKFKKDNAYNAKFLILTTDEISIIKDVMTDEQHDMSIYLLFQELSIKIKDFIANFIENQSLHQKSQCSSHSIRSHNNSKLSRQKSNTKKKNHINAQNSSQSSNQNNQKQQVTFHDDLSTIESRQSTSIPESISIHNNTKQFVTVRKHRKGGSSSISSYESKVRHSSKSHKHPMRNGRKSSGFPKLKSPLDRHYIPAMNEGVQGMPDVNPDASTMFMAGVA